ncbi:MAG TPA: hypothetical protein VFY71_08340 [Planctomycetota bacterium]|nr:hypothetical protein [Planctomycetota bacterium]
MVYVPMVPGDDRAAAAAAPGWSDARASCFWDGERLTGRTWGAAQREQVLPKLLPLLPAGSPEHEQLASWDPDMQPLWDVGWFFAADARWPADGLPPAAAWCKQFAYSGGETGANGFFRGEGETVEVAWSSWHEQFAAGMATILGR